jgi:hypothetical protein
MQFMKNDLADKNRQWLIFAGKLKGWELKLIEMRYNGFGYGEIEDKLNELFPSKKLNYAVGNLRMALYHAGQLRPAYDAYAELMGAESLSQAKHVLESATEIATRNMVNMMSKKFKSDIRYKASKDILDRNLGRPVQQIVVDDARSAEIEDIRDTLKRLTSLNKKENVRPRAKNIKRITANTEKR